MKSQIIIQNIHQIICIIFLGCLFSCGSSSEKIGQNINISDGRSAYEIDDKLYYPSKSEGFVKERYELMKYTLMLYDGTEGCVIEFAVPPGTSIVGEHLLNHKNNKIRLNYKENGLFTVYNTLSCYEKTGKIVIEQFKDGLISGYFWAELCNKGGLGEKGNKNIPAGKFKSIKIANL